jgi:hypothetical protein
VGPAKRGLFFEQDQALLRGGLLAGQMFVSQRKRTGLHAFFDDIEETGRFIWQACFDRGHPIEVYI